MKNVKEFNGEKPSGWGDTVGINHQWMELEQGVWAFKDGTRKSLVFEVDGHVVVVLNDGRRWITCGLSGKNAFEDMDDARTFVENILGVGGQTLVG